MNINNSSFFVVFFFFFYMNINNSSFFFFFPNIFLHFQRHSGTYKRGSVELWTISPSKTTKWTQWICQFTKDLSKLCFHNSNFISEIRTKRRISTNKMTDWWWHSMSWCSQKALFHAPVFFPSFLHVTSEG